MAVAKGEASMMFVCSGDAESLENVLRFDLQSAVVESRRSERGSWKGREDKAGSYLGSRTTSKLMVVRQSFVRQRAARIWLGVGAMR